LILRSPPRSTRIARIASRRRPPARLRERRAAYRAALLGPLYCDTSALLKLYLAEPGSAEFTRAVEGRDDLVVSDLAVTEVASALSRRVRQGAVTPEAARRVQRTIVESLDGSPYQRVELTRELHRRAEHLLLTLTTTPLRAADALHLALALSARAASMAVFDARLAAAARAAGLAVYPAGSQ
jgi:predicted nucleic acid-binding protein